MNPRTTGLLALVAALLGAFVYFYELRGGSERKQVEEASRRIFPEVEATSVDLLDLTSEDGIRARALRREGRWVLVEPVEFPGDTVTLDGMASSLAELTSEATIESPERPEVYGLGEEAQRIAFRAGGREHGLLVGGETPVGASTYVTRASNSERVFTVSSWRIGSLSHTLDELRDRRVMVFDRGAVNELVLRWPGAELVLEKKPDGWWIREPAGAGRADDSVVESLLSDLSFLRATGFRDSPLSDDEAIGLGKAAFEVLLRTRDATASELRFVMSSVAEAGERLVRGRDSRVLYRVAEERLSELPRSFFAYRFKELSSFVVSEVGRAELVFSPAGAAPGESHTVRLERDEVGVWHASPEALREGAAARLLAELARLEGVGIVADAMGPEELAAVGLAPPRVILRVFERDESGAAGEDSAAMPVAEVQLGDADPERGVIAKSPGRETVYRVDYELAERIPVSYEAFESRFLASGADGTGQKAAAPAGDEAALD